MVHIPIKFQKTYKEASIGKMIKGWLIDVALLIFAIFFPILFSIFLLRSNLVNEHSLWILVLLILFLFNLFLLPLIYFAYFYTSSHQATIGMKLNGIQVISKEGERLKVSEACQMYLSSLFSLTRFFSGASNRRGLAALSRFINPKSFVFIEKIKLK